MYLSSMPSLQGRLAFLIRVIDVSVLAECTDLGWLSQVIGNEDFVSFASGFWLEEKKMKACLCFWPMYKSSTFQVLAMNEDCGLLADSQTCCN